MTNISHIETTDPWIETKKPESPDRHFSMAKLPNLLRFLGSAALLVAMYSFLFQGWQAGNDVFRYLMLLGHTGALTAIGLMSGHWLKESKGARLLVTMALVSIPVNFAVLGAFIYSQTPMLNPDIYPHYVAWSVDSMTTALSTTAGALLLLIPVTLLGFRVLSRNMSNKLSILFLASNALLLLPIRDPQLIGLVVLAISAINVYSSQKISHNDISAKTSEGLTALGLQMLPVGVLLGRSLWLYSLDLFLLTMLAVTLFFFLKQAAIWLKPYDKLYAVVHKLSLLPALATVPLLSIAFYDSGLISDVLALPIASLLSAAMVFDISRRDQHSHQYRDIASSILMLGIALNLVIFSGITAAIISAAVGLGLLLVSFKFEQKKILVQGLLLMLMGIGHQLLDLIQHFDLTSWASLATFGVLSIVIASTIESKSARIKPMIENWKQSYRNWK